VVPVASETFSFRTWDVSTGHSAESTYPTTSISSSAPTPGLRIPSTFTFWCR
jgi:hypothetical protein